MQTDYEAQVGEREANREDQDLIRLIMEWDDAVSAYQGSRQARAEDLPDQIASLEGRIVRNVPQSMGGIRLMCLAKSEGFRSLYLVLSPHGRILLIRFLKKTLVLCLLQDSMQILRMKLSCTRWRGSLWGILLPSEERPYQVTPSFITRSSVQSLGGTV